MNILIGNRQNLTESVFKRLSIYRHEVFVSRLKWPLDCKDALETDQFDHQDTEYVVVRNDGGEIMGCARLLPSTSPYLLSEVFPELLNGLPAPCAPDVWELSRFSAANVLNPASKQFCPVLTSRLLNASVERARQLGAKRLISVSPVAVERLLRRLGYSAHRVAPPRMIDGEPILACWIDIG